MVLPIVLRNDDPMPMDVPVSVDNVIMEVLKEDIPLITCIVAPNVLIVDPVIVEANTVFAIIVLSMMLDAVIDEINIPVLPFSVE